MIVRRILVPLLAAASLYACTGGDILQVVRTGGTGAPKQAAIVSGPITGFGSLIVNGVRFDESGAQVTVNGLANRPVTDLKLGMVVEVRGEIDEAAMTGVASSIAATPLVSGPVQAVSATGTVTVTGQSIRAGAATALQGASTLGGIKPGDLATVYGLRDPGTGSVDATRIEIEAVGASVAAVSILGAVSNLSGGRFSIAGLVVDASRATLANLAAGLANGDFVQVRGPAPGSDGVLFATAVEGVVELSLMEGLSVDVDGYITNFASPSNFRIEGQPVSAGGAILVGGTVASLMNGTRIEVEGIVRQGTIIASKIDVKSVASQPAPQQVATVEGAISDFVSVASFRVRDQTIDASAARFEGGARSDLANGRQVRVSGPLRGDVVQADVVTFLASSEPEGSPLTVSGAITDFTSAASFRVNGQAVFTGSGTVFVGGGTADLANGRMVSVDGNVTAGVLVATRVTILPATPQPLSVQGYITDFVSATSFKVNNVAVTTSAQTLYEGGNSANLANGRKVTITGTLSGAVLVASKVHFDLEAGTAVEVEGAITDFVSIANFKVKGQLIDASAAKLQGGTAASLRNGRNVHATGPVSQGFLRATLLQIDD
jgi:cytochrome c-type biogenesis protein CcmE